MTDDFKKESYWKLVEEFVQELKTAKYWLKPDGKPNPEWKLFEAETWAAARGAAGDAAGDAVWTAARDIQANNLRKYFPNPFKKSTKKGTK